MSVEQMRAAILKAYPMWAEIETKPANQIRGIYYRLLDQKKL